MNRERLAKLNVKANVLKAMAHPSRLCIVEELSKRERCVCELTEMIGADMSTVSKHLTVLKHAGIIADEKRGRWCSTGCACRAWGNCLKRWIPCWNAVRANWQRHRSEQAAVFLFRRGLATLPNRH